MRFGKEGGTVAALLRNHHTFWSSHLAGRHFGAHFSQTSPARLFLKMRYVYFTPFPGRRAPLGGRFKICPGRIRGLQTRARLSSSA